MIKIIITALLISITLCGCTYENSSSAMKNTEFNSNISNEQLEDSLLLFISGEDASNIDLISDDIEIDYSDIITDATSKEYKAYETSNSIYIQIDSYMYRFQFNSDSIIVSYIKYNLEA